MVASSPNAAPPAPKCALERYGLIREQRNVIIVVVSSASLALRLQTGKSGAASYLGERVPPTNGVSGLNRSAVPFPRARSLARSHCSAAFYFRALRSLSRSPDHRDGLRGGERGGAARRRGEWGLLGRWSHRAPSDRGRERGDACTTVRAVNFMTLPSTGDKRGKRKKNGGARPCPPPPRAPRRATKYEIGRPSSHLVTPARQRQLRFRMLSNLDIFLQQNFVMISLRASCTQSRVNRKFALHA